MSYTICFTGHRPKGFTTSFLAYQESFWKEFQKELESHLIQIHKHTPITKIITGGAQGIDQIAFHTGMNLYLKGICSPLINKVIIPFRGQEARWRKKGLFGQDEYNIMLSKADEVQITEPALTPGSDYKDICNALEKRNHLMIDQSDLLIAILRKDEIQHPSGGTGNAIRYAYSQKKQVLLLPTDVYQSQLHII